MPVPRPAPPPGVLERLTYIQAPVRSVWATLHDPAAQDTLFPELRLGPAAPSWPAAGATRAARLRLGLLVANVRLESLEARPSARFQLIEVGDGIRLQRGWFLEEVAGGTRVAGTAGLTTSGRWRARLIAVGRGSVAGMVETHLRILKEMAEGSRPTPERRRSAGGRP